MENNQKFLNFTKEILNMKIEKSFEFISRQKQLYKKKRKLINKEFRKSQKIQLYKSDDLSKYYRIIFDRYRFIISERNRLTINLFEIILLRNSINLAVIRDIIAFCKQSSEIDFRPDLKLDKYYCSDKKNRVKSDLNKFYD
jgi:hypothetical protein